jgi:hypothetical protein
LNHVRVILGKFNFSKDIASAALIVMLALVFAAFLGLGNTNLVILVLMCVLLGERVLYGEDAQLSLSTLRMNKKSISISDRRKRKFLALSFIEVRLDSDGSSRNDNTEETKNRIHKASSILGEHVGCFSVEIDSKTKSARYMTTGQAKTATEASQKAETLAQRVLRILREIHGENAGARIIEGERIKDAFLAIIGGNFEVLSKRSKVVQRLGNRTCDSFGFILMKATDGSIGIVNVEKIISLVRDLEIDVTYVISLKANRTCDENALIDGIENSQMWLASSFFVVSGTDAKVIREKAERLRRDLEDMTRGGVLRIESGSATLNNIGGILLRSLGGKKLFLSNEQLISHIFAKPLFVEPSQHA